MADVDLFGPRAWVCLFGVLMVILLVVLTSEHPARHEEKQALLFPWGFWSPLGAKAWPTALARYVTRPGGVTGWHPWPPLRGME